MLGLSLPSTMLWCKSTKVCHWCSNSITSLSSFSTSISSGSMSAICGNHPWTGGNGCNERLAKPVVIHEVSSESALKSDSTKLGAEVEAASTSPSSPATLLSSPSELDSSASSMILAEIVVGQWIQTCCSWVTDRKDTSHVLTGTGNLKPGRNLGNEITRKDTIFKTNSLVPIHHREPLTMQQGHGLSGPQAMCNYDSELNYRRTDMRILYNPPLEFLRNHKILPSKSTVLLETTECPLPIHFNTSGWCRNWKAKGVKVPRLNAPAGVYMIPNHWKNVRPTCVYLIT